MSKKKIVSKGVKGDDEAKVNKVNEFEPEEKDSEKALDPDLLLDDDVATPNEDVEEEEVDEDLDVMDDDEVDPFKDKWEE